MRIAQISPLYESVPPRTYGGTERIVSYLTEELTGRGHDVTLFASGDSSTSARLVPICEHSLRLSEGTVDPLAYHCLALERLVRLRDQFDVIHFHVDYLHYSLSRAYSLPQVTTLHGRLDLPELAAVYDEFGDMPLISISDAQRTPIAHARWVGTVHHGLPPALYSFHDRAAGYLAFLGRISPEKGIREAVDIATCAGMPLKVAAKIDKADREYFQHTIAPLFDLPHVEFLGEIGDDRKAAFLGAASALLAPVDWPEPFGLVLIEALACGTPVIAFNRGSIPEIIDEGETGFVVTSVADAVDAVKHLDRISRRVCRDTFERRFTAGRMADDYLAIYRDILELDNEDESGVLAAV